jgi:hypothetical protein
MSIIISQDGKNAQKVDKTEFGKEGYLQNYIHENPESIPVYEIEEDKKLFVVAREFSTESGPIDALAIDKDGDIYVVETKLYKNPDKRTVVAQALDYGASLWRHSNYDEFVAEINNEINKKFQVSFEEKIKEFFGIDDEQITITLEAIKRNLQQGNIKFVILMDAVEDRLKDLIVYVNQNSQFDIYAVQMEYYKFEKYEIIIPKLFGVEVKKSMGSSAGGVRPRWDEQRFFEEVKTMGKEKEGLIRKLYNFSKNSGAEIIWGTGRNRGSFSARFENIGTRPLFVLLSNGRLSISLDYLRTGADQKQNQILDEIQKQFIAIDFKITAGDNRTPFEMEQWAPKINDVIGVIKKIV